MTTQSSAIEEAVQELRRPVPGRVLGAAGFTEIMRAEARVVETVRRQAPDLVVIDMALPDRDAFEGVRALSASAPKPIVRDDPGFVEDAIAAGSAPIDSRASRTAT